MTAAKNGKGGTGNKKPKRSWTAILQRSLTARDLIEAHAAALGSRLSPDFVAGFLAGITSLSSAVPAALTTKKGAVQSTAAQNAALAQGHYIVAGVHTTVRGRTSDKQVLLAYGIGVRLPLSVKHVTSALQAIIARVAANPAEAAGFGITADDQTAFNAALAAITAADAAQEAARAAAPVSTKARNATARQLLADVKLIAGAGMRVFANDLTTRALFVALT